MNYHSTANRSFNWISSVKGDPDKLRSLHESMMRFYSQQGERKDYQKIVQQHSDEDSLNSNTLVLAEYIKSLKPKNIVKVGCADGRLYRVLQRIDFDGKNSRFCQLRTFMMLINNKNKILNDKLNRKNG